MQKWHAISSRKTILTAMALFVAAPLAGLAQTSRRDAVVILVLDRSGSMNWVMGNGQTACGVMRQSALDFLNNFVVGQDAVGLVAFDMNVYSSPATTDFINVLTPQINQLTCGGGTGTA
jgi:Mg-chelatase subunit ChlD